MDELIKQYLKEHLRIRVKKEWSYSGKDLVVELRIDDEVISKEVILC